jgi:hypothetical protein
MSEPDVAQERKPTRPNSAGLCLVGDKVLLASPGCLGATQLLPAAKVAIEMEARGDKPKPRGQPKSRGRR